MSKKKAKKPRADHYDEKLQINGSFEDVIKVSVTPTPEKKEEEKPVQKKKK
jgi:hypothetical protein